MTTTNPGREDGQQLCWCCGRKFPEVGILRLGARPEAGICVNCTISLRTRARERTADNQGAWSRWQAQALRRGRETIMHHHWHERPVLGPALDQPPPSLDLPQILRYDRSDCPTKRARCGQALGGLHWQAVVQWLRSSMRPRRTIFPFSVATPFTAKTPMTTPRLGFQFVVKYCVARRFTSSVVTFSMRWLSIHC